MDGLSYVSCSLLHAPGWYWRLSEMPLTLANALMQINKNFVPGVKATACVSCCKTMEGLQDSSLTL